MKLKKREVNIWIKLQKRKIARIKSGNLSFFRHCDQHSTNFNFSRTYYSRHNKNHNLVV